MDATTVDAYIREAFPGVETTTAYTYTFYFHGSERMLPFATMATADNEHDRVSGLDRDGAYRLNVGVSRETYRSLFGDESRGWAPPASSKGSMTSPCGTRFFRTRTTRHNRGYAW